MTLEERTFTIKNIIRETFGYPDVKVVDEAASRIAALMPEPLAELADKKGCWLDTHNTRNLSVVVRINFYQQTIGAGRLIEPVEFRAKTYEQAESAAREYLEKMEDVKI